MRAGPDHLTPLAIAEVRGHTTMIRLLRRHRRRDPGAGVAHQWTEAERAAAEQAATALMAEEEAEKQHAAQSGGKRSKSKSKRPVAAAALPPVGARQQEQGSRLAASAIASSEHCAATAPPANDESPASVARAADEALRDAVAAADYDVLTRALDKHCTLASEMALAEARTARNRLHKKRKKESQKLRRQHADEMKVLAQPPAPTPLMKLSVLTLEDIAVATGGFAQANIIGSGAYGRVFFGMSMPSLPQEALPPSLRNQPVAVKRAKAGMHDLHDLRREVGVLKVCDHPHVLPLLGYYLESEAPCLVFPLMRGGSLADRLWPADVEPEHLHRLGLFSPLAPLAWQQRLRILRQATDALLYLHTPAVGGKGCVIHRDFKPENILLDEALNAYVADTGFAKMEKPDAAGKSGGSTSNALYLTRGYLDSIIGQGGEYSAMTDGYALGITLLVTLTARSPKQLIHVCEEEFEEDFGEIAAEKLADRQAHWPPAVATAIKELALSSSKKCLCHQSGRKRLALSDVLQVLNALGEGRSGVKGAASTAAVALDAPTASGGYLPTPLSMQVRALRTGADAHESVKDNVLVAFGKLLGRLDVLHTASAARAPLSFEDRIDFWRRECGMPHSLADDMHQLRVWSNAARHKDDARWARDGPQDGAEASRRLAAVELAIQELEREGGARKV